MRTVLSMLTLAAETYANDPYVVEKEEKGWIPKTFLDVEKESALFAKALIARGFKKEDKVAILSEGRRNWVISEFGLLKAQCIAVPLSIKLLDDEIPFRLNHSESSAIVVSENSLDKILSIRTDLEKTPLIIVLSNYGGDVMTRAEAAGLRDGKDIILYSSFIEEGKNSDESTILELEKRLKDIGENDVVTISYTSGTTGNPKGIMLTHLNYYANSADAVRLFYIPERARTLVILPLDHSFAHTIGLYVSLRRGLAMYFVDARGGGMAILRNIPGNLVEAKPYFLLTVPALSGSFMKKIQAGVAAKGAFINGIFTRGVQAGIKINRDGYRKAPWTIKLLYGFNYFLAKKLVFPKVLNIFGGNLKFCVGGGALLEVSQQEFFNAIGAPIYQGYGLTEATPVICTNTPPKHKFGTSGIVLPSIECRIMKDEENEAEPGVPGELIIRGENVMKGYYKNTEASDEVLKDGWLWTGDLGYFDSDGFLVITGRAKALLIAADGEKYSPETIEEAVLNYCPYIHQIMAYNEQKKTTTALVTLNESEIKKAIKEKNLKTAEELFAELNDSFYSFRTRTSIPSQWIPGSFAIIQEAFSENDQLINSTMKLVRYKVRDFYWNRIEAMYKEGGSDINKEENLKVLQSFFA
ncbi:AMP-dependent synthetase [Oceanispirochaeta crateris]|uniref:AMP-dependent synthetase n=1 Tax=Oceanispirochaeta crateris TaxID=2518645 RepID=A0A5C1QU22_9SPIO|nr:AMP-binding protein [Oceanispirochaeta crateris]QEN09542.1 AMP-dependent synthetase [Oceanispirochaeta crateris]